MSVKFANNAFGTLNAGISNSATSITLSSGQGARFPTLASGEYFYATLIDTSNNLEVVKCTARSTDVLTVTRAQESTSAQAFAIGDRIELRVTAQGLDDAANPYDKDTSSTGSFALPVGTTAQQPTAADTEGHIRYDSDDNVVYYSNGTNWLKVSSVVPVLSSVTGSIVAGVGTTLTLAGTGFLAANLTVRFVQTSDSVDEQVTVTPTSDTAATVTVPAAVYNNVTGSNVVSITVTNSDNVSSASVSKTALAAPSGGTVTTSGNYRIHSFTSSGSFINTISGLDTEYLVVAGGGGGHGGFQSPGGGGGGAGGMITGTVTNLSVATHTVTVGSGGTFGRGDGSSVTQRPTSGGNSAFGGFSATGGGFGGGYSGFDAGDGGSGGGEAFGGGSGSGTSGQGNNGGSAAQSNSQNAAGGGGKSAAGSSGNSSLNTPAGAGGAGAASSITGSSVTYAGGGGGGGGYNGGSGGLAGGAGGSGGGGAGGTSNNSGNCNASSGSANTGGGGGGAGGPVGSIDQSEQNGGNGGSGIVVVRYDTTTI